MVMSAHVKSTLNRLKPDKKARDAKQVSLMRQALNGTLKTHEKCGCKGNKIQPLNKVSYDHAVNKRSIF